MALPSRLGGLGLGDPRSESESEYSASQNISHPISELILQQHGQLNADTLEKQRQARSAVRQEKRHAAAEDTRLLLNELPDGIKRVVNLAAIKSASNWSSVLPVAEPGFDLNKTAFKAAICLRFGWRPERLPEKCVCGTSLTVEHALTCSRGGFSFLRHSEIRDISAKLLTEVYAPTWELSLNCSPSLERLWTAHIKQARRSQTRQHKDSGEKRGRKLLWCKGFQPPCTQQPPYLPKCLLQET